MNVEAVAYRSDIVNKVLAEQLLWVTLIVSAGRRAALRTGRRLPRRTPAFFQNRLMTSIPSRNVKRAIDQILENI